MILTDFSKQAIRGNFDILKAFATGELRVVIADTPQLREQHHETRHQVFCVDNPWEPTRQNHQESDEHDLHSTPLVVMLGRSPIGAVRFAHGEIDGTIFDLPLSEYCSDRKVLDAVEKLRKNGETYAEISRIGVPKHAKHNKLFGNSVGYLSLIMGIMAYANISGTDNMFFYAEPKLIRNIGRFVSNVQIIGDPVDHHGERYPVLIERKNFIYGNSIVKHAYPRFERLMRESLSGRDPKLTSEFGGFDPTPQTPWVLSSG